MTNTLNLPFLNIRWTIRIVIDLKIGHRSTLVGFDRTPLTLNCSSVTCRKLSENCSITNNNINLKGIRKMFEIVFRFPSENLTADIIFVVIKLWNFIILNDKIIAY